MTTELEQYIRAHADIAVEPQFNDWSPENDCFEADQLAAVQRRAETNIWGWCCIHVTVTFNGLEESESLGGCSYDAEVNFRRCPYFTDMVNACVSRLADKVAKLVKEVAPYHVSNK